PRPPGIVAAQCCCKFRRLRVKTSRQAIRTNDELCLHLDAYRFAVSLWVFIEIGPKRRLSENEVVPLTGRDDQRSCQMLLADRTAVCRILRVGVVDVEECVQR